MTGGVLRKFVSLAIRLSLFLAATTPAEANVAIPAVVVTLPGMVVALVPVILIEAVVLCRMLRLPPLDSIRNAAWANIFSTFLGIPLAWLAQMVITLVFATGVAIISPEGESPLLSILAIVFASGLLPPDGAGPNWGAFAALLVCLIPAFFASWHIEYRVVARRSGVDNIACREALFRANIASYIFLGMAILTWWISSQA